MKMRRRSNLSTLLPLAVSIVTQLAHAQTAGDDTQETIDANRTEILQQFEAVNATNATNVTLPNNIVSSPYYTAEQCDAWIDYLIANDEDSSLGLAEEEYFSFLQSIEDPPYIKRYFENFEGFNKLPWVFRVVHKSLACHCEKLGLGEECCEGDNAEVLTLGLDNPAGNAIQMEYKDLFCQQIAYVLTKTIPSPAPTASPSEEPTVSPSSLPPSASPTTRAPTTPAPITGTPTFTVVPTISAAPSNSTFDPSSLEREVPVQEDEGLSAGAIAGIILALLAILLALLALLFAYKRRLAEENELRKFAGVQAPEEDLEAPITDEDPDDDAQPGDAPDEDDESSAPSVWSASEDEDEMTDVVDDGDENRETVGSSLAAVGAASTVVARLGASG